MASLVWLSFPLDTEDPRPPAIPAPELAPLYTIEKDGANVQILRTASHTGTHLDSPRHVIQDGLTIGDYRPEELIFHRPALVDLPLPERSIVTPEHLAPISQTLAGA